MTEEKDDWDEFYERAGTQTPKLPKQTKIVPQIRVFVPSNARKLKGTWKCVSVTKTKEQQ